MSTFSFLSFLQFSAVVCVAFPGALIIDTFRKKKTETGFCSTVLQPATAQLLTSIAELTLTHPPYPCLGLDYPHGIITVLILKCFWPLGPGEKRREGRENPLSMFWENNWEYKTIFSLFFFFNGWNTLFYIFILNIVFMVR